MNSHDKAIVVNLSNSGTIKVEGADAQTFLHNQFTNDLKSIDEHSSQLSAYCNPKGRILALFRVFKQGDAYYLIMPKALIESTLKRLRMFVLMSKVTLEDVSEVMAHLGCSGAKNEENLKKHFDRLPNEIDCVVTEQDTSIIRIPGIEPRFELLGPQEKLERIKQSLMADATEADSNAWELLDIHAGIPTIHPENIEAFVPQMVNLQAINGLSFKKGCYPGQEIVARMQYLGKLKRRMYLAHCDTETPPHAGCAIFADDAERKVGTVVSAQASPKSGVELLAVIEIEAAESGNLHLDQGDQLTLKSLPYALNP